MPKARPALRREYENPPVVEAVCQFHFTPLPWDFETPYKLYAALKENYPEQPMALQEMELKVGASQAAFRHFGPERGYSFSKSDPRELVQAKPESVSIHIHHPYPGGGVFRDRIQWVLERYTGLFESWEVRSISIRYIDRIHIDSEAGEDEKQYVRIPEELKYPFPIKLDRTVAPESFFSRLEFSDGPLRHLVTFGSVAPGENLKFDSFLIDLDLIWKADSPMKSVERIMDQVGALKQRHIEMFENMITDHARRKFGERSGS